MLQDPRLSPTTTFPPGADAYGLALRHSARVRRLKVLLPTIAVIIGIVFFAVSFLHKLLPENLKIEGATIENGKIVMENPAISGRNNQGISYSMRAKRALQEIADPDVITLETIHAEMPVNDRLVATVDATTGVYDRGGNTLDMTAPFTISMNNGVNADFQSAWLDITKGEMETKKPIAISLQGGSIVAQTLRMTDKGRVVKFAGQVRVNLDPVVLRQNQK